MKKLFSIMFCFILAFSLVACSKKDDGNKDKTEEKKITVNFETNGGSQISSQTLTISADGKVEFTLPADPVKTGYVFAGWFLDNEFKGEFKALDLTKESVTLYAKWNEEKTSVKVPELVPVLPIELEKGLNYSFELNAGVKFGDTEATAKIVVDFKTQNIVVEKLEDADFVLTITPTIVLPQQPQVEETEEDSEGPDVAQIIAMINDQTFKLVLEEGILYAEVPGAMLGSEQPMVMSLKLKDVIDKLALVAEQLLATLPIAFPEVELNTEEPLDVSSLINEGLTALSEAGLNEELIAKFVALVESLLPEVKAEGNVSKIEFTQADFTKDVDTVVTFVKDNFDSLINLVFNLVKYFEPEADIELPNEDEKAGALAKLDEFARKLKEAVQFGKNELTLKENDNKEIYAADCLVDVTLSTEEEQIGLKGTISTEVTDTKATFSADLDLSDKKGDNVESVCYKVDTKLEKVNDNKATYESSVVVEVVMGEQTMNFGLGFNASAEVKDNSEEVQAKLTVEALGQTGELTFGAKVVDNGGYTKEAYAGKEYAMDMTESVLSLIDSFLNGFNQEPDYIR